MEECINGNDLLIFVGDAAAGHSTACTVNVSSETKDRAFKPAASLPIAAQALFKNKTVTGLSVSVSADGFAFFNESEYSCPEALAAAFTGQSVKVEAYIRGNSTGATKKPFLSGNFIITSVQITANTNEDVTYSLQLENDGAVELDKDNFTHPVKA